MLPATTADVRLLLQLADEVAALGRIVERHREFNAERICQGCSTGGLWRHYPCPSYESAYRALKDALEQAAHLKLKVRLIEIESS